MLAGGRSYDTRLAAEQAAYQDCINIHELPKIFHYWSNRYVRPKLEAFGFSSPDGMFAMTLADHCRKDCSRENRVVSLGSGNCDLEIRLCAQMVRDGLTNFAIDCIDLNPAMLSRAAEYASQHDVARHFRFVQADFNKWLAPGRYDYVLVNQALHHVTELEHLLDAIYDALADDGVFVTSEMIGRNGHLRWPEALNIVREFWAELPARYKWNHQLKRQENKFLDWDCSVEAFEGVRAQDILPLLVERFGFRTFVAFGNVIDPFVDRGFGHNFDADSEADRVFIDRVHARDEMELAAGRIKPTHLLAVMTKVKSAIEYLPPFTPEFCVRRTR